MNVATYGFTILSSHLLGPREFGEIASILGLLLVVNVPALGLQATGARQAAAHPDDRELIRHEVLAATVRTALGLGALCLLLTPVVTALLSLDTWWNAALIAVSAVPLTIMGGQAGILQGERRWAPLAGVYVAAGLGRLVLGLALVPFLSSSFGAMLAVAGGAWLPVLVGAVALRRTGAHHRVGWWDADTRSTFREVAGNGHSLLAFFCLSNVDVVVARATFAEHPAGLYAAGLILT